MTTASAAAASAAHDHQFFSVPCALTVFLSRSQFPLHPFLSTSMFSLSIQGATVDLSYYDKTKMSSPLRKKVCAALCR
ncbi:Protein of unknown function [Pyronema omphalodes CBS 100304]|uniref:Uncharacterized protein n=1 Tax=Pyronema omphalodes (strain CBS 100304) TaxID=1076935 RepID=U4LWB6_PYROM|nr:Protein of unknown function [Pyronema omphalodes CBS 100304]